MVTEELDRNLRHQPQQMRSVASVEKILDAARTILLDDGLLGFNTNVVARVANVNVATVYRYFPDKNSILAELIRVRQAALEAFFIDQMDQFVRASNVQTWVEDFVSALVSIPSVAPELLVLRQVVAAVPQLSAMELQRAESIRKIVTSGLQRRYPFLSPSRCEGAGVLVMTIGPAIAYAGTEMDEVQLKSFRFDSALVISGYARALENENRNAAFISGSTEW